MGTNGYFQKYLLQGTNLIDSGILNYNAQYTVFSIFENNKLYLQTIYGVANTLTVLNNAGSVIKTTSLPQIPVNDIGAVRTTLGIININDYLMHMVSVTSKSTSSDFIIKLHLYPFTK